MFNAFTDGDFNKAHERSDLDAERSSMHHTIGRGPNQAAAGNHKHTDEYAAADHTHAAESIGTVILYLGTNPPSAEYLLLNGQSITRDSYPGLFGVLGIPAGTNFTYLPDMRDRFPVGASATKPVKTTGQTNMVDLTVTKANDTVGPGGPDTVVTDVTPANLTDPIPPWLAFNFFVKAY